MCNGLNFCSSCTEQEVQAWGRGETHETPAREAFVCQYGNGRTYYDKNFHDSAYRIRQDTFVNLLMSGNPAVLAWPEAGKMAESLSVDRSTLLDIVRVMPEPSYVRTLPKNATAKQRSRHAHAKQLWAKKDSFRLLRTAKKFLSDYFRMVSAQPMPMAA